MHCYIVQLVSILERERERERERDFNRSQNSKG